MGVEELEGGSNLSELIVVQLSGLGEVTEIHEGADSNDKEWGRLSCDDGNEVSLNVAVSPTSNLFEL